MTQKRQRASKVCDFCKKRKVKCDLGNPCSACVRYKKFPCVYSSDDHFSPDNGAAGTAKRQKKLAPDQSAFGQNTYQPTASTMSAASSIFSSNQSTNSLHISEILNNTTCAAILENPSPDIVVNGIPNGHSNAGTLFPSTSQAGLHQQQQQQQQQPSSVQSELAFLKEKLQSLEYSLQQKQKLGNTINNINSPSTSGNPSPASFTSKAEFSPPGSLTNTLIDLKALLGVNPVESDSETINFYNGYNGTTDREPIQKRNYGPLSWISLTRMDNALVNLWPSVNIVKEQLRAGILGISDKAPQMEQYFEEKARDDEGENDLKPYRETVQKDSTTPTGTPNTSPKLTGASNASTVNWTTTNNGKSGESKAALLHKKALCLGLAFYEGGLDHELELLEKIRLVLPNQKIIWSLYKRFFTHLYLAFPIVDEVVLKEDLQKLIGYENYSEGRVEVKIEKKLDFAYLGILLLILRLSYISLFSYDLAVNEVNFETQDPSPQAQETKYLLNNVINVDVINVAQECLDQFNIMRNCNLTLMQLALLTRLYHQFAPEDGDGIDGGDSQVFNGMLVQMAYSLGLHREPDLYPESAKDEKINNLSRKIWYMIVIQDLNNAMSNGTMLCVSPNSFDVKIPFYRPGNENVIDIEMEKTACNCYPNLEVSYTPLTELLGMILQVKGEIKMVDLAKRLDLLENHFKEKSFEFVPSSPGLLKLHDAMPSTLRMKIFFTGNFLLVSIYAHLYNYYETKKNVALSFYYLKKIFVTIIYDVMPYFSKCVNEEVSIFKASSDFIAVPSYESVAHKSLIVLGAVYLRIRHRIRSLKIRYDHKTRMNSQHNAEDEAYRNHFEKLVKCADLIVDCREVFRNELARLSQRYYYAWRISKAQDFIVSVMTDEFFERYAPRCSIDGYSTEMIGELEHILESSLERVIENKKLRKQEKKKEKLRKKNEVSKQQFQQQQQQQQQEQVPPPQRPVVVNSARMGSTGSTSSSEIDSMDYKTNNEIDSMWIQMMNLKNQEPKNAMNYATPSYNDGFPTLSQQPSNLAGANNVPDGNASVFTPNLQMDMSSLFENFPIDELFKELQ
ncbi:Multidrug resistance regulator 1 [Candida viswanathii]|uniref:Multidrug resistance regulator 1 n=1 Tax=Candida viswanathii TaxID=5486 RepID=A0A367YKT5_9ASCO|nr:Multidrug resistance regulator 1 [Candida viswanathii]